MELKPTTITCVLCDKSATMRNKEEAKAWLAAHLEMRHGNLTISPRDKLLTQYEK